MFINLSNHPSDRWGNAQRQAALAYGPIRDMPFPHVDPAMGEAELTRLADELAFCVRAQQPAAVLCQGEFTLAYGVIARLQAAGIPVLAACTRRISQELQLPGGGVSKSSEFRFEGFRRYPALSGD